MKTFKYLWGSEEIEVPALPSVDVPLPSGEVVTIPDLREREGRGPETTTKDERPPVVSPAE